MLIDNVVVAGKAFGKLLVRVLSQSVVQILNLNTGWSMSTWRMEHKAVCSSKQVGFPLCPSMLIDGNQSWGNNGSIQYP